MLDLNINVGKRWTYFYNAHSIGQGGDVLKIVVFCCDDRMLQVCDNLQRDHCVIEVQNEEDLMCCRGSVDAIILPVKGVDVQGCVGGMRPPCAFWEGISPDTTIFSGMQTPFLESLTCTKQYYMEDAGVIGMNAILTAEGVLNELIGCCPRSLYDLEVDVVGYGNCGKVIYEMLQNLHVSVRMIRRVCQECKHCIALSDWKSCGDIIINTSMYCVMDQERMCGWHKKPVIIDIATPDVIDASCAQHLGIRIIKAGNLPGRFASISAGNIIADYIRGKLGNGK